jgi:hypothetical protein
VVVSSSSTPAFVPVEQPRVAVAADGTLAAIQEPSRITVVEIPSCAQLSELGTDPNALASEVAWVGTPPRLLVLSRFESHSTVHLVDPFGPRSIAEIRLEAAMRLYASVGSFALAIGSAGTAMLAASDRTVTPYQFPARAVPTCAGASGTQFVVALPGVIEEWDPQSRMPKRRLKLPRPATITAVGGSDRVVWMTTQQEPARIDVIPLVNRGQPKAHDLPEPIATVASHPRSDVITCIGATSGRVYVVDLDGRAGLRVVGPQGIDRAEAVGLVLGRVTGVLAAQSQHAITVVPLERGEQGADASAPSGPTSVRRSSLFGGGAGDDRDEGPTAVSIAAPPSDGRSARGVTAPPIGNLTPATTKLQPPMGARLASSSATPVGAAPAAGALLFSGSSAAGTGAATPARASQAGFDQTVAPPFSTTPADTAQPFAAPPPTRPSQSFVAPGPVSAPPPTSASDARAIDDTLPPPSLGMPPLAPGSAALGAALGSAPGGGASLSGTAGTAASRDGRRGMAETIPVVSVDERRLHLDAFRDRVEHPRARTAEPSASMWAETGATWRDDVVVWTRNAEAGQVGSVEGARPLEILATRFDVTFALIPALAWLYGQHLLGRDGAAPADLASLPGAGWDEALGRGDLAGSGLATLLGSRVRLADVVVRALDERPPVTGTLVGATGIVSLLGPCAIVAEGPLRIIAEACLSSIGGAILAANVDADPSELVAEARAYGAAPLWRVKTEHLSRVPAEQPIILVADDDATADLLGVPRLT